MTDIILGRQPIFDPEKKLRGYEILFRSVAPAPAAAIDGDHATATVMLNTVVELGIDNVVGPNLAWFNMTEQALLEERYSVLPPDRVVLEVLESLEPTADNLRAIRRARLNGYSIALDDFVYSENRAPLLDVANFVKLEFPAIGVDRIAEQVEKVRRHKVSVLAEKIETQAEYEACRAAGCDLFQGFFFCKPDVLRSKALTADTLSLLRLLSRIQVPDVTLDEVEALIEQNLAFSVRVLKLANSGLYAVPRRIESIRHAGIMLGLANIRTLATLLLLSGMTDKPHELMVTGLVRAKMCALLAKASEQSGQDSYFTVGLLSVIDALMDRPMEELVTKMSLSDELVAALVRRQGPLATALRCAIDSERGTWDPDILCGYGANTIMNSWIESLDWARTVASSMEGDQAEAGAGGGKPPARPAPKPASAR
jgi:EAL and modified HD-GYP domain-containing signal transduction protein